MNDVSSSHGLWSLVVIDSAVTILFAFSLLRPSTKRERWPFALFSLCLIAFFFEKLGFPLTAYVISDLVASAFLVGDPISSPSGSLLNLLYGDYAGIVRVIGLILAGVGIVAMVWAWQALQRARRHQKPATDRPYTWVRHPQYAGLILMLFGLILMLPTFPSIVVAPVVAWLYVRLAIDEEKDCLRVFGFEYRQYVERTPAFVPRLWSLSKDGL